MSAVDRSSLPEVRNPLLALPAARELAALIGELPPEVRTTAKRLLRELKAQCRAKEVESYRKRKGPLVAYWMAAGTYAKHIAQVISK